MIKNNFGFMLIQINHKTLGDVALVKWMRPPEILR